MRQQQHHECKRYDDRVEQPKCHRIGKPHLHYSSGHRIGQILSALLAGAPPLSLSNLPAAGNKKPGGKRRVVPPESSGITQCLNLPSCCLLSRYRCLFLLPTAKPPQYSQVLVAWQANFLSPGRFTYYLPWEGISTPPRLRGRVPSGCIERRAMAPSPSLGPGRVAARKPPLGLIPRRIGAG